MRFLLTALLASVSFLSFGRTLDRTREPLPLLITRDTDMSDVVLIDDHATRPAVIVINAKFKLGEARRLATGVTARSGDPGLGDIFNGKFLERQKIDFSHHDFARAMVVGMGSFEFDCPTMSADIGVLALSESDGTYGQDSVVNIGRLSGFRFGVMATGQKNLSVTIKEAYASLWPHMESGAGHAFYANEARHQGKHMRLLGVKVRIGKSRGMIMAQGIRADHVTAKFKGAWDVDYECLDDQNPCGALDQFESSGRAKINWRHPGGDAQCGIFLAFRCGEQDKLGKPNGRFIVSGEFDTSLAPDPSKHAFAFHMHKQNAFLDKVTLIGTAKPDYYGKSDLSGLRVISD